MIPPQGTRLGPYQIEACVGAGGMGEVYRARDTRLGRDVALKVLLEVFAADPERMARFSREAQVLASLNHPHIATIHGLEESNGVRALVMELVDGPTLADRIEQGPMPLDEALPIARQIAEALEYAHERGIIHRDLKPANVKVTSDAQVKLLDFGLAKALEDSPAAANINTSPTISAAATRAGIILGTAAYMSPEQARGKSVDRRCDIWSFGAVLFEMLSGKQAFAGEDISHALAAVIMKDPEWGALPGNLPPAVVRLLRRCLVKEPRQRLQSIGEARIAIDEIVSGAAEEAAVSAGAALGARAIWHRVLPWATAGVLALALVLAAWAPWRHVSQPVAPLRLSVELGADGSLNTSGNEAGAAVALSPDGKVLVFTARRGSENAIAQLFVRRLDNTQAVPLPDTEGAHTPFFSPDGQWIAFFAIGKLKKVSVFGGAPVTLCDAVNPRGGDWVPDGNIVFSASNIGGLSSVSEAGGTPAKVTTPDSATRELTHRWPQVLPGGQAVLFTAHADTANMEGANIVVQSLRTGERKILVRGGTYARYVPTGFLLYVHQRVLFMAPFDVRKLEMTGVPVPAIEDIANAINGAAQYAFSPAGTLLYLPQSIQSTEVPILWMYPDGKTEPLRNVPGSYLNVRLSPDGRRVAVVLAQANSTDIWVYEPKRDAMSRLTFGAGQKETPAWTPDGLRLTFASDRAKSGITNLYWQRADGTGDVERLTESEDPQRQASWHPSGKFLAFQEQHTQTNWDITILPMGGSEATGWKPGKPYVFFSSSGVDVLPAFSPDGRWLAYMSNASGNFQLYVRPFPGPGGVWQVSTNGGFYPVWSRSSHELFYQDSEGRIMVLGYKSSGGAFQAEKPRAWSPVPVPLPGPGRNSFDVTPDGKRMAVLKAGETQAPVKRDKVTFFFGFADELARITRAAQK